MTLPRNGLLSPEANQQPTQREQGLTQVAYGRGEGWGDDNWAQFVETQEQVADQHDRAAESLRLASAAMREGRITPEDQATINRFNSIFGDGAATEDSLQHQASRYEVASMILRDQDSFKADRLSGQNYAGLPGVAGSGLGVAATPPGGRRMFINSSHPDSVGSALAWALSHEPFHAEGLDLRDQTVNGVTAYWKDPKGRIAYTRLMNEPERAMDNPDHLTRFSRLYRDEP